MFALMDSIRFCSNLRPLSLADLLEYRIRNNEGSARPNAREADRMRAGERLPEHEHARKKAEGRADVLDEPDKRERSLVRCGCKQDERNGGNRTG